jgi:hypothetical protein
MDDKTNNQSWISQALLVIFPRLKREDNQDTKIYRIINFAKSLVVLFSLPFIIFIINFLLFLSTPVLKNGFVKLMPELSIDSFATKVNQKPVTIAFLEENRIKRLEKSYAKFSGTEAYLIVNTT